ncbi:MAG TPA: radical SAM protein [Acidimicrobiales bacterium]|nr:radical SAM protein [Acidimicrobiales bacterium]
MPPIGLAYLAGALRQSGADVVILDLAARMRDFRPELLERVPDALAAAWEDIRDARLVGIGPLVTATLQTTKVLVDAVRQLCDVPVVVGGPLCAVPHIDAVADCYLGVDASVSGDGEHPIVAMWEALRTGRLQPAPGVRLHGAQVVAPYREKDLDTLPVPARDLLDVPDYHASARRALGMARTTAVFLSRGCPYSCSFCAAPLSSGRQVRRFSRPRIEDELRSCAELRFDNLVFYDDCLFVRSASLNERVIEFAEAVASSGWRGTYQLELRCDAVVGLDNEALASLSETGCRQINMGIEKGSRPSLAQLRKRLLPDVAVAACDRIQAAGIRSAGTFILGGVGETEDDLAATIDFACGLALDLAHFNPLAIYPGTTLYREVFGDASWLDLCLDRVRAPLGDILYESEQVPLSCLMRWVQTGYEAFYTASRLTGVLERTPDCEHQKLENTYRLLARERGHSWDVGSPVEWAC